MPIELRPMKPSDFMAQGRVFDAAFVNGLSPYIYPNGKTQADVIHLLRKQLDSHQTGTSHSDEQAGERVVVAYDTEDVAPAHDHDFPEEFVEHRLPEAERATWGKIVGVAIWILQPVFRTEEDLAKEKEEAKKKDNSPPPSANAKILEAMDAAFSRGQAKYLGGNPYLYLKVLAVHPEAQRIGVGKKLMDWGLEVADRLNLPIYLEGSEAGLPLYHAKGFEDLGEVDGFDLRDFGAPENKVFMCMLRPAAKTNLGNKNE